MTEGYASAGVDIQKGDKASSIAYRYAKETFANRKGKIGEPVNLEMGFSGLLDMGPFYLAFNSDGVGSKTKVAQSLNLHETLGYDLVAMVADDCVCVGAEPVSLVNTLDMEQVDPVVVDSLMKGLKAAASEAGVAVAGGEIAELRDQVKGYQWGASLIGVVKKDRVIDGSKIQAGDRIIGLLTDNFRSNGFTLIRRILESSLGPWWHRDKYDEKMTWGEKVLAPSKIFTPFIMKLIGRFDGTPTAKIHGIAHITGGGLKHNMERILPKGLETNVRNLPPIPEVMARVKEMGKISKQEAYQVWNMGIAMALYTPEPENILQMAKREGINAVEIGVVEKCGA